MVDETLREDLTKGNWNTAGFYVKEKIQDYLKKVDSYYELSIFGTNDLYGDVFMTNENLRNTARIHSLKRLIYTIITLLRNTKFAVLPKDQPLFKKYIDRLLFVVSKLYRLKSEIKSKGRINIIIDEVLFDKIINEVMQDIMDDVNFKLNKAGLIFTQKEEYDVKEQMKKFKDRIENI